MTISHYRLYCETEAVFVQVWSDTAPTVCPNNSGHTLGSDDPVVLATQTLAQVQQVNENGAIWNQPQTTNKTPLFNPNIIPPGYLLYVTGAFDDINGASRGDGTQMILQLTEAGDASVEGRFLEHVYVLGGEVGHIGGGHGDWASLYLYGPASAPEDKTSTHDGNANKAPTGFGFNIIVPAPGDNGDWNVDGATLEAGEINQDLVPLPSDSGTGYWNWDPTVSPSITPVANPAAPDGGYNLYDAALPIARQANRVPLVCAGDCCPSTIKGKKILPHWVVKLSLHRAAAGTVSAGFVLKTARIKTT